MWGMGFLGFQIYCRLSENPEVLLRAEIRKLQENANGPAAPQHRGRWLLRASLVSAKTHISQNPCVHPGGRRLGPLASLLPPKSHRNTRVGRIHIASRSPHAVEFPTSQPCNTPENQKDVNIDFSINRQETKQPHSPSGALGHLSALKSGGLLEAVSSNFYVDLSQYRDQPFWGDSEEQGK